MPNSINSTYFKLLKILGVDELNNLISEFSQHLQYYLDKEDLRFVKATSTEDIAVDEADIKTYKILPHLILDVLCGPYLNTDLNFTLRVPYYPSASQPKRVNDNTFKEFRATLSIARYDSGYFGLYIKSPLSDNKYIFLGISSSRIDETVEIAKFSTKNYIYEDRICCG